MTDNPAQDVADNFSDAFLDGVAKAAGRSRDEPCPMCGAPAAALAKAREALEECLMRLEQEIRDNCEGMGAAFTLLSVSCTYRSK